MVRTPSPSQPPLATRASSHGTVGRGRQFDEAPGLRQVVALVFPTLDLSRVRFRRGIPRMARRLRSAFHDARDSEDDLVTALQENIARTVIRGLGGSGRAG